nr:hypothetical protein [Anaerolineae bacterium]
MTEDVHDPVQQETPEQQPATTTQAPVSPDLDWEARYKGSVKKIQDLTIENRDLKAQLEQQTSDIERLNAHLSTSGVEKDAAVGERDKIIEQRVLELQAKDRELEELRSFKAKVTTARELDAPELIDIIDNIPSVSDPEALKTVMADFKSFADRKVKQREEQLMAGFTPPVGPVNNTPTKPSTRDGWQRLVNNLPLGSAERQKALDDWFESGMLE